MNVDDREVEGVWGLCEFLWAAYFARTKDPWTYDGMWVAPLNVQRTGPALGAWSFVRFVNMARSSALKVTWEWESDVPVLEAQQ